MFLSVTRSRNSFVFGAGQEKKSFFRLDPTKIAECWLGFKWVFPARTRIGKPKYIATPFQVLHGSRLSGRPYVVFALAVLVFEAHFLVHQATPPTHPPPPTPHPQDGAGGAGASARSAAGSA